MRFLKSHDVQSERGNPGKTAHQSLSNKFVTIEPKVRDFKQKNLSL